MKLITSKTINGIVGLSVLAMFTVAIVAGQARSNRDASALSRLATKVELTVVTVKMDAPVESKPAKH